MLFFQCQNSSDLFNIDVGRWCEGHRARAGKCTWELFAAVQGLPSCVIFVVVIAGVLYVQSMHQYLILNRVQGDHGRAY